MNTEKTTTAAPDAASAASEKTSVFFLLQGTYSSWTWMYRTATDPDDFKRPPDMEGLFKQIGVTFHGIWYSLGEYDFTGILEVEKAEDMAALIIAMRAGWDGKALDNIKATQLLPQDAAAKACAKASEGLKSSRDATKDGPLTGTMDYTNAEFKKEQK